MGKQIKTMEQLKDSRILFEKDLPFFGYMLIFIVVFFLFGITVWGAKAHKPYMIISQGTVTNSNSAYVMPVYTGEIEECSMEEGKLVQEGDILFTIKSIDYNLQEEQLQESRESYKKRVEQADMLVKSIKDNENYFDASEPDDELYYSTYEAYKSQITQSAFDASTYQTYGYTEEQIQRELEKNQGKIAEIYYTAIQSAENMKKEAEQQIESIDAQLAAVGSGRTEYSVKASAAGILHMLGDYKKGMVVQTGAAVATIMPQNAEVIIESYVSTADMARTEKGDEVQMAVDGLLQSVYGTISGEVISIDSNLTMMEGEKGASNSVFKIKIKPDIDYVVSKSGKKINLANGMTVEARIIYDEATYLDYVLDKLGLKAR